MSSVKTRFSVLGLFGGRGSPEQRPRTANQDLSSGPEGGNKFHEETWVDIWTCDSAMEEEIHLVSHWIAEKIVSIWLLVVGKKKEMLLRWLRSGLCVTVKIKNRSNGITGPPED